MDEIVSSGWNFIADNDGAAALIGAILQLDTDTHYTRSELADAADLPLKELYLSDALEEFVAIGLLESVPEAEEATYVIDDGSSVYEGAATFESIVTEQLRSDERDT